MNKKNKIIFTIIAILLFLGLAFSPVVNAKKSLNTLPKLTIILNGITDDDCSFEVEVTKDEIDQMNLEVSDFLDVVNNSREPDSLEGVDIAEEEWNDIKICIFTIIDSIGDIVGDEFPAQKAKNYVSSIVGSLFRTLFWLRQPIISVGFGITWIPFYDYETFLGRLLRPVFIWHLVGFSVSLRINPFPPPIPYCKLGSHRIRSLLFDGIFINLGDLGYDSIIGSQLLIGYGFTVMA